MKIGRNENSFDGLRIIMALLVVFFHSWWVSPDAEDYDFIFHLSNGQVTLGRFAVIMFFGMSGYLITASWERRRRVLDFLLSRILRIYPALIMINIITVFLIGPIFTNDKSYWQATETWLYFENLLLYQPEAGQRYLPRVFHDNFLPKSINPPLWTLEYEVICYTLILFFGSLGLLSKRNSYLLFLSSIILYSIGLIQPSSAFFLLLAFLSGGAIYLSGFKKNPPLVVWVLIIILFFVSIYLGKFSIFLSTFGIVALINIAKSRSLRYFGRYGDPSYGIYIYSMPIQQSIIALGISKNQWLNLAMAIVILVPLSYLSWHLLESKFLKLLKRSPS